MYRIPMFLGYYIVFHSHSKQEIAGREQLYTLIIKAHKNGTSKTEQSIEQY